jgi:DNA polymerase IV
MPRTILHLDLDAFFCAVEELRDPSLRGKPFAVGGQPDQRGVVASCSYAARQFGVRSAMPTARALKLCPELIIISHHHGNYGEMSDKVMERLDNLSPLVEQISIDEAFVDISDIREPAEVTARKIQTQVRTELGLPCSVGVASNKLVAKIATEVGKHSARGAGPPNAVTIVPAGQEAEFLAPLPVEMLWGVGPKTASSLSDLGIKTIGDLAAWNEKNLVERFGENGREMARHARGISDSPVVTEHEVKSISQETTFARDVRDDKELESTLKELSAQVGRRLRRSDLTGKTVKLKIRWPDFTTLTRQATLSSPTDQDDEITVTVIRLMKDVRSSGKPVRLIGVGVSGLTTEARQLELWGMESEKRRKFQGVIDELQDKFGEKTVHKGQYKDWE